MPVQVGLYSLPLALIAYAIFGSSRHVAMGPTSTVAIMSGSIVFTQVGSGDPARAIAITAGVAIAAGLVLTLAGLLRLGWATDFISRPVITGFSVGLALIVLAGELPHILGLPPEPNKFVQRLGGTLSDLGQASPLTIAIAVVCLVVIFGGPKLNPRVPWALLLLAGSIIATIWWLPTEHGVEVLGQVPAGLPSLGLPELSASDYVTVALGGVAVAIAGVGEGLSAARVFATRGGYRIDADQEFLGSGVANVASGLSGGMSVCGSISRTGTAATNGGKTQITGLVAMGCVVVVLVALTNLLTEVPRVVLSAIVVASVWFLLDFGALRHYWKVRHMDFVAGVTATLGVLIFGPLYGLLAAVLISVLGLTYRATRMNIDPLGKIPGEAAGWGAIINHPERKGEPGMLVLRIDAPLFWANAAQVHDRILAFVDETPDIRALVLVLEATGQLDTTTIDSLHDMLDSLRAEDVELFIARLHYPARVALKNEGFADVLGKGRMWHSISQTVVAAQQYVAETAPDESTSPTSRVHESDPSHSATGRERQAK